MAPPCACPSKTRICVWVGPLLLLLVGLVPLALGIWCTVLYMKYTPVYKAVVCRPDSPQFSAGNSSKPDQQEYDVRIPMVCDNPNPYPITMSASTRTHDKVFVGSNMTLALEGLINLPSTTLPKRGSGTLPVTVAAFASQDQIWEMLDLLNGTAPIPIFLTLGLRFAVNVQFFHKEWKVTQSLLKECGIAIKDVLTSTPPGGKVSKFVCASSFDDLRIPSPDDFSPISNGLSFLAEDIEPDAVRAGTLAKDIGLGTAMAWGYGLFILFACTATCLCTALRRKLRRRAKKAAKAAASKNPTDSPSEASPAAEPQAQRAAVAAEEACDVP